MLFPLIGVAVGIAAVAGIIKFACDELSEEERAHQRHLLNQFEESRRHVDQQLAEIEENKNRRMVEIRQSYGEQYNAERETIEKEISAEYERALKALDDDKLRIRGKLVDTFLDAAIERNNYIVELQKDINSAILAIKEQEKECKTLARKNALRHLIRELYETREKSNTYKQYIGQYQKFIGKFCRADITTELELMQFTLPSNYLYKGKIITLQPKASIF